MDNPELLGIYAAKPFSVPPPREINSPDVDLENYISDIITRNELSYNATPTRLNDMTLHNEEAAFYVPTVEVTINYLDHDTYSKLLQIINSKGFFIRYSDQELGEVVIRSVYATDDTIERLYTSLDNYVKSEAVLNLKLKFVSRYGYPYTTSSDPNFNPNNDGANKYHMYQLHAHRSVTDFLPSGVEEPDYV